MFAAVCLPNRLADELRNGRQFAAISHRTAVSPVENSLYTVVFGLGLQRYIDRAVGLPVSEAYLCTVGQLQFEVIQYRLENEYSAKCRWEPLSLYKACWIESDDPAELEAFKKRKYQYMAKDREGRDVFLADSGYVLQMAQMDFKNIKFHFTSEF